MLPFTWVEVEFAFQSMIFHGLVKGALWDPTLTHLSAASPSPLPLEIIVRRVKEMEQDLLEQNFICMRGLHLCVDVALRKMV